MMMKSTFSTTGSSSHQTILKDAGGQSVTGESKSFSHIEQAGFYTYFKIKEVGAEEKDVRLPNVFSLYQPYPNPVASHTAIKYGIPKLAQVSIKVYDITGRGARTLVDCENKPGLYKIEWDGKSADDTPAQGVYFVRMLV